VPYWLVVRFIHQQQGQMMVVLPFSGFDYHQIVEHHSSLVEIVDHLHYFFVVLLNNLSL